jgi:hypothetical protein
MLVAWLVLYGFRRLRAALIVVLTVWLIAGCAGVPTQELSEARRAYRAAEQAGADTISASTLHRVATLVDQATSAVNAGEHTIARTGAEEAKRLALELRSVALALQSAAGEVSRFSGSSTERDRLNTMLLRAYSAARSGDLALALDLARSATTN